MAKQTSIPYAVRVDRAMLRKLDRLASATRTTRAFVLRRLIVEAPEPKQGAALFFNASVKEATDEIAG